MKYLHFLKYNNYANRIFKFESSVSDYTTNGTPILTIADVKLWNPNDGIYTEITTPNETDFSTEPDYLITSDDEFNVDSRWFIIEAVRLHRGQYKCTLKRDVFAEAWDDLMQATCNIDRAILNKYSPLIFNPEPISVNQILDTETLIKDQTRVPWIVFYGESQPSPVTAAINYNYDYTGSSITTFAAQNTFNYLSDNEHDIQAVLNYVSQAPGGYASSNKLRLLPYGIQFDGADASYWLQNVLYPINITNPDAVPNLAADFKAQYTLKGSAEAEATYAMNDKIFFDTTTSKHYRLHANYTNAVEVSEVMPSAYTSMLTKFRNILTNCTDITFASGHSINDVEARNFRLIYWYRTMTLTYEELTEYPTIDAQVPASSYVPTDAPYFMWCMPYGTVKVKYTIGGNPLYLFTDKDVNLAVAQAFARANSTNKLWDVQILPFCPLPDEFITGLGEITVPAGETHLTDVSTMTETIEGVTAPIGFIFSCPKTSFKRQIRFPVKITPDDPKISDITEVYRLYSPNYGSSFEFSLAKNDGLSGVNVRCTYMPIQPYIRVAPIWGGIYGNSTQEDDVRGLICGGDYSMARVADAWVSYQEQNKNFESIFNREISHMDVARKYERINQIVGSGVGVLTGAGAGAFLGNSIGGKVPTAIGAGVGAAGAMATGITDVVLSESMYRENKSYATDMHNLQLGNVQAMPVSLARTTAFHIDNRYFPILAKYKCTDEEKKAVVDFIVNRSMNVGIIDKPGNYMNIWSYDGKNARVFMQGSIIKIDSKFDVHLIDELNAEFQKGVYLI